MKDAVEKISEQEGPEAENPPAASRPISFYLLFLVSICLIPMLVFSAYLLVRTNTVQQSGLQTVFQSNTRSIVQVVEQEIVGMMTTLRVLSTDPTFRRGNLGAFQERARRALVGRDMDLIVLGPDLNQLMNTRIDYGGNLPSISDRGTPQRAFDNRTPAVSDAIFSQATLTWRFYAALPVFDENGEGRLLILARDATSVASTVEGGRLLGAWQVAIVDGSGNIVVSSDDTLGPGTSLPFDLGDGFERGLSERSFAGDTYQVIRERSTLTSWSVVAWTPQSTIRAPVIRSIILLFLGGVTISALAALAALFVGRRVTRSARRLSTSARFLGAGETVPREDYAITEFGVVGKALAQAAHDRTQTEGEIRLLMREVAHRSKNQLTVINAMVGQTAKNAASVDDFVDSFRRRITGLARSTDLLLANAASGIDFRELVESQIEPFMPSDSERVRMLGPRVKLDAQPAQTVGMAIHELATNAAKYGALSDEESRLEITWWRREGRLSLTWREYVRKMPEISERKGFGSVVLERMMGGTLEADIERTLHENGIEWHFAIPLERLRVDTANPDSSIIPDGTDDEG